MEISDVWGEAKEQIGGTIDKNATDTATLNGRADDIKDKMFDQDLMYQVGDILMSIDSAPSEKWLKCDGATINKTQSEFSELYNLLPTTDSDIRSLPNITAVGRYSYYVKAR